MLTCLQAQQLDIGVSPEVLKQLAEAEAKAVGKGSSPQSLKDIERQMVQQLNSYHVLILLALWNPVDAFICACVAPMSRACLL